MRKESDKCKLWDILNYLWTGLFQKCQRHEIQKKVVLSRLRETKEIKLNPVQDPRSEN